MQQLTRESGSRSESIFITNKTHLKQFLWNHFTTNFTSDDPHTNGGYRMGNLGQIPPYHLCMEEPDMLLIKIMNFMSGQDQFSYKNHENMHILLAFITNSPETKANQSQTN